MQIISESNTTKLFTFCFQLMIIQSVCCKMLQHSIMTNFLFCGLVCDERNLIFSSLNAHLPLCLLYLLLLPSLPPCTGPSCSFSCSSLWSFSSYSSCSFTVFLGGCFCLPFKSFRSLSSLLLTDTILSVGKLYCIWHLCVFLFCFIAVVCFILRSSLF